MNLVLTAGQALGLLAVLVGVAIALPVWGALVVDGLVVLVVAVAAERIVALRSPSDARSRVDDSGVE